MLLTIRRKWLRSRKGLRRINRYLAEGYSLRVR